MSNIVNLSRRKFLTQVGITGGAFVIGMQTSPVAWASDAGLVGDDVAQLGYFVSIAPTGTTQIVCHRCEMGQGIMTSVPQIIAEEMGANWDQVNVILGKADPRYGNQSTGGSASIRKFFEHIRQMGAVARDMLEQAAAQKWDTPKSNVVAANHQVRNKKTDKTLSYGELAEAAAKLPMPDPTTLSLKDSSDFKLIGKDVKLQGLKEIVTGTALYAQDVQLPDMLIASIQRPPVVGGKVKSFDASEAQKVAGVVNVVRLKDRDFPVSVKPVSGVAVLATNTWAAHEARKKLKIQWDLGEHASHNSEPYLAELVKRVKTKGETVRSKADVYDHSYVPEQTIEAVYTMPYHHHMSMETPSATAMVESNGHCRVWSGTQTPQWGKSLVLEELGMDPKKDWDKVEFNVTLMGGAFGRKGKNDFTLEAVELAKKMKKPVKVVWTRADDVQHGFYHSTSANYFKAELTKTKSADYWIQRVAHPPIPWIFDNVSEYPSDNLLGLGFADMPFEVQHLTCEKHKAPAHVRIGWFRAVQNIHNWFALGCFVDELAVKADIPTHKMWLNLLGQKDRIIDPRKEGFSGWKNYDLLYEEHAVETARMKKLLNVLMSESKADKKAPQNEGWGISIANSFNSYAAAATRVKVVDDKIELKEMHTVIDCGLAITPDRVRSQMEGAMIMGISLALDSAITIKDGAIEQTNFNDYTVTRMPETPELHVHLIESQKAPGGVGEPGLPPIVPSIVNAIYHASGKRYRDLPVRSCSPV